MIHNVVEDPELAEEIQDAYSPGNPGNPDRADNSDRVKGPKSRQQVLERFGPPHKIGALGDGRYAFGYEYRDVVERQMGIVVPGYSILKIGAGRTGAGRQILIIEFSDEDEVLAAGSTTWNEDVGFGFNLQLFFSVAPTSNTKGLLEKWSTESWATHLLHTPVGLVDLSHDPDSGSQGIRFSGMPKPGLQWPAKHTGRP